jgi:hypothetical protein
VQVLYASPLWSSQQSCSVDALDTRQEIQAIREGFGGIANLRIGLATVASLQNLAQVSGCAPRILHLSAHCFSRGPPNSGRHTVELVLEDEDGGALPISLKDLELLLGPGTGTIPGLELVVLNMCWSEALAYLFTHGFRIKHVVCIRGTVFDAASRIFLRSFYGAISSGRKIDAAFATAQQAVKLAPQPGLGREAEKFLLLPDWSGTLHAMQLGPPDDATYDSEPDTHEPPQPSLPVVEDFIGREQDLWKLLRSLKSRHAVLVHGRKGIGKTALLAASAGTGRLPGGSSPAAAHTWKLAPSLFLIFVTPLGFPSSG